MKIVLIGYMGSGKSTIGHQLSKELFLPFIDLDTHIEKKEQLSISTIFKEKGEIYFRKREHQLLVELLQSDKKFVLSLGGGTPCYANNMSFIKESKATSIYLKASITTLVNRLLKEKSKRPLIANLQDSKISEFVAKHLFERRVFYEEANTVLNTDTKSVLEIVTEIRNSLY